MSRNNPSFPLALLLVGAGTLITGCVATANGQPEPAATIQPPTTTTSSTAPKVQKQLDATRLVSSPCDALTTSELIALDPGFTTATTTNVTDSYDAGCGWTSPDLSETIDISFEIAAQDGLEKVYRDRESMAYWQPMVIDGYPAVAASLDDGRADGTCVVNAGISDHLFFFAKFLSLNAVQKPQSCSLAVASAGDVIKNLGGGN